MAGCDSMRVSLVSIAKQVNGNASSSTDSNLGDLIVIGLFKYVITDMATKPESEIKQFYLLWITANKIDRENIKKAGRLSNKINRPAPL
jgi:hypothetical protein